MTPGGRRRNSAALSAHQEALRTRNGSATSSTVSRSSPTEMASVDNPTGPPPNRRHIALSTERSRRSRPSSSTS